MPIYFEQSIQCVSSDVDVVCACVCMKYEVMCMLYICMCMYDTGGDIHVVYIHANMYMMHVVCAYVHVMHGGNVYVKAHKNMDMVNLKKECSEEKYLRSVQTDRA